MILRRLSLLLVLVLLGGSAARAQESASADEDSLGLPGDNLDLAGVLELFKKAESLEAFEKALNEENNYVNNLDLNGDNNTDYIRVVDQVKNDTHAIVLQVPISETESQDVAMIAIEKNGSESAQLQIIGDEELYGDDYVVEPQDEKDSRSGKGPSPYLGIERPAPLIIVNVWGWPCIRWVYAPRYVIWVSPWRWAYYPPWWRPWRPVAWHVHHHHAMMYHPYCRHVHVVRVVHARNFYHAPGRRVASPVVHQRYAPHHTRYQASHAPQGRQPNANKGKARETGSGHATGRQSQPKAKAGPRQGGGQKSSGQRGGAKGGRGGGGGGKRK